MTRQDVKQLMESATSERDWSEKCEKVRAAHKGQYPYYWYEDIFQGGVRTRVSQRWELTAPKTANNDVFGDFVVHNLAPDVFDSPVSSTPVNDEPKFGGFGGGDFGGGGAGSDWDSGSGSDSGSSDSGSGD